MAEINRFDLVDRAIEAMLAGAPLPALDDAELAALAEIAAELRDLPREDFYQALKTDLERSSNMATQATEMPATRQVKPIPEGYHTATPYLIAQNAAAAIDFYKRAFGATEIFRYTQDDGRIGHAEIQIGDSRLMLADEFPERGIHSPRHYGGSPVTIMLYVEDVDAIYAQALAAGATVERPLADQPYGDRNGGLFDPFGHRWFVATHTKDVEFPPAPAEKAKAEEPAQADWTLGIRAVTPYLQVEGGARLIDFLVRVFGAEERLRVPTPDGKIMHADVRIGDSIVELADAGAEHKPTPTGLHLYVPDVDAVYDRALQAGAVSIATPTDHEYGERGASVRDPLGNHWYLATAKGSNYIRQGLNSLNVCLHPLRSGDVIEFLKQAYGAKEEYRAQAPDGTVRYAQVRVADSVIELGDAHGPYQPMRTAIHLHVPDCDAVFAQALAAGAAEFLPLKEAPYGERVGGVTDPFGNIWYIATLNRRISQ